MHYEQEKRIRDKLTASRSGRLLWFALALDPSIPCLASLAELHGLVVSFINRNDEAIEKEKKERRAGRPKSKMHEKLELWKATESLEYEQDGFRESMQLAILLPE